MVRCSPPPDAICSSCHNAEARKADRTGRENSSIFFFFEDIHGNSSMRGKKTSYFGWILSMHFGFSKMASLSERGVKTFHSTGNRR